MSTFSSLEDARTYFANDRYAAMSGITLDELTEDGCVCSVTIEDKHRNALGGVMGGVIFTLADFAFAVSVNNDHASTVALDANIHFLSAPKGARLIARSARVRSGRTTVVYEITIRDDLGKTVALFVGTGYKL